MVYNSSDSSLYYFFQGTLDLFLAVHDLLCTGFVQLVDNIYSCFISFYHAEKIKMHLLYLRL